MKCIETVLNDHPIDAAIRTSGGNPPRLIKQYIATSNMRPAGLIACAVLTPINPWPWANLSAEQWRAEMEHNNGLLILLLLRLNRTGSNRTFLSLFDSLESEYSASMSRMGWIAKLERSPEKHLRKVLSGLSRELEALETSFVGWAADNRQLVASELEMLIEDDELKSGNALKDLERWAPSWYVK